MRRRRLLGAFALAALALSSGCLGVFGPNPIPDERLDADPPEPYAWNENVDVHLTVTADARFQAVYRVNDSSIELYRRDGFGGQNAIPISAVRYRYPNGTVITGSQFENRGGEIERSRDAVTVQLPSDAESGKLAFTSESSPKRFTLPTFVEGSYEVVLPPDRRVDFPIFGSVTPRGYETFQRGDRTHVRWNDVTARAIVVQFYLERDLYVFGALAGMLLLVGAVGVLYYRTQIEALRERRREVGPDVDTDDDGPPPGMR